MKRKYNFQLNFNFVLTYVVVVCVRWNLRMSVENILEEEVDDNMLVPEDLENSELMMTIMCLPPT
jgi:hypothetical protein